MDRRKFLSVATMAGIGTLQPLLAFGTKGTQRHARPLRFGLIAVGKGSCHRMFVNSSSDWPYPLRSIAMAAGKEDCMLALHADHKLILHPYYLGNRNTVYAEIADGMARPIAEAVADIDIAFLIAEMQETTSKCFLPAICHALRSQGTTTLGYAFLPISQTPLGMSRAFSVLESVEPDLNAMVALPTQEFLLSRDEWTYEDIEQHIYADFTMACRRMMHLATELNDSTGLADGIEKIQASWLQQNLDLKSLLALGSDHIYC